MLHPRVRDERPAARPTSIPGTRLPGDALDNRADAAPRPPRTTGRTKDHGSRQQFPDPPVARSTAAPTVPGECSARREGGPAGTRPRDARRAPLPPRIAADQPTRRATPAPTRRAP